LLIKKFSQNFRVLRYLPLEDFFHFPFSCYGLNIISIVPIPKNSTSTVGHCQTEKPAPQKQTPINI
jgi:hypothetical protein